ncbi:MAG: hypothetical protein K6B51_04760 [Bacilli bacterium]|nr:hypothetical protein [Bacilli bacterium]
MKRRKTIIVPLAIASFALSGCFIDTNPGGGKSGSVVSSRNDPNEVKTISARIKAGYGSITEGKVSLLFDGILLPFSDKDYDIDYLAVGDFVEISYKGEWVVDEMNPSKIKKDKIKMEGVKVTHSRIVEIEVAATPGGGVSLRNLDASARIGEYSTRNCIDRDRTFEEWSNYPTGSKIYAITDSNEESAKVLALYGYNPSESKESLTLKECYSWARKLKEDDIAMVISGDRHGSICPTFETLNTYCYSEDSADIHRVYEYLNTAKFTFNNPDIPDGTGSNVLTVVKKSGEKYSISALQFDLLVDYLGEVVTLDTVLPSFTKAYGNSFLWQAVWPMEVSSFDEKVDYTASFPRIKSLKDMIFQEIDNPAVSGGTNEYNVYKFFNSNGEIVFESNTDFTLHSEEGKTHYYRVVNDITFNYLKGVDVK